MDVTEESMRERISGYELVLYQIRRMYTNPELRNVIDYALAGNWEAALYNVEAALKERDREEVESMGTTEV